MTSGRILNKIWMATGARLLVAVLMVFSSAFFVRAQVIDASVRVTYPFDNAEVRADYMANAKALAVIDSLLAKADSSAKIEIVTYSSPEGPESYNLNLSRMRARSIRDYIISAAPYVTPTFRIASYAESWAQFRAYIAADKSLSAEVKSELLLIIDSDSKLDEKEAMFKADPNYKALYRKYFRSLRYADISLRIENSILGLAGYRDSDFSDGSERDGSDRDGSRGDGLYGDGSDARRHGADSLMTLPRLDTLRDGARMLADLARVQRDTTQQADDSGDEDEYVTEKVPVIAIHNNFLAEAATVGTGFHTVPVAFGVEVPIGKHWSIYGDYMNTIPWHAWNNNADCVELMHWGLGTRWYPGTTFKRPFTQESGLRVLEGWYASLSGHMGYYDFERKGKGYQGEEANISMGFGYSMCFDEHWSLNFGIAFGPMYTQYRYYEGRNNNSRLVYQYGGHTWYFGPTDARISLTYLFYATKKHKKN